MALIHEPVLRQTLTGTGQTDSIRVNETGMVIVDCGGSTFQIEVKNAKGAWIPLCAPDGTAYSYTNDIVLQMAGRGHEYRVNLTSFSAALYAEIHAGN